MLCNKHTPSSIALLAYYYIEYNRPTNASHRSGRHKILNNERPIMGSGGAASNRIKNQTKSLACLLLYHTVSQKTRRISLLFYQLFVFKTRQRK